MDAVRTSVSVEQNGGANFINIRVTPFKTPVQDKTSFIVAFEPSSGLQSLPSAETVPSPLSEDERSVKDRQIVQLKQELDAAKEYLQSIIEALESTNEELQSANEEIQSGNEEMQSTNEELQTSKEELESADEKLHTVNEEMQHRNELLTQLNNDLTNLLNSVNLPIVMVGPDLSVRRFTPQAAKVLGLTAADFGRPITRLRLKTDLDNLEQVLLDVIAEVRPQQYRIRDSDGNLCALRLTPYRTADNRIDGVVLNVLGPNEIGSVGGEAPPAAAHAAEKRVASKTAKKAAGSKAAKTKKKKITVTETTWCEGKVFDQGHAAHNSLNSASHSRGSASFLNASGVTLRAAESTYRTFEDYVMASKTFWALGAAGCPDALPGGSANGDRYDRAQGTRASHRALKDERRHSGACREFRRHRWNPKRHDPPGHTSAFRGTATQALHDVFITEGNLAELADGLGTALGAGYSGACPLYRSDAFHQPVPVRR